MINDNEVIILGSEEDEELRLNLVRPDEPPRDGKPRTVTTDKTRFLVRGKRDKFEARSCKNLSHPFGPRPKGNR